MKFRQKFKNACKTIRNFGLVALVSAPFIFNSATANADSVEIAPTNKDVTLDMKLAGDIAPRTSFFARNMASLDYENKTGYFGLFDLMFNVVDNLLIVGEAQVVPEEGIIPRAGLGYSVKLGDADFYISPTILTQSNPNLEIFASASYAPNFGKAGLYAYVEDVTNVGKEGHNYSIQRIRAGPTFANGKYSIGGALDLTEGKEFSWKAGGFAKVNF